MNRANGTRFFVCDNCISEATLTATRKEMEKHVWVKHGIEN